MIDRRCFQTLFSIGLLLIATLMFTQPVKAAPYASIVMDARTGEVLYSRNAETRLHPASLTKMMTLYIAFEAVENGEIGLNDLVTISSFAAAEPPSKLGLQSGQRIAFRFLIRAAAVRSANDAATAIAEAIEGSEAAFARRMNRTAQAMGMRRTNFHNAHGLTQQGHMSTARDMNILGRHMIYDYPEYYNLFSRQSTHAGIAEVRNTNRRFLSNYEGADGIKTGYTRAAGSNLTASAERGRVRIVATIFGGQSSAWRDAHMAELMDIGFDRAPRRVSLRRPSRPRYRGPITGRASSGEQRPSSASTAQTQQVAARRTAPQRSYETMLRPAARPAELRGRFAPAEMAALAGRIAAEAGPGSTIAASVQVEPEAQPDASPVTAAATEASETPTLRPTARRSLASSQQRPAPAASAQTAIAQASTAQRATAAAAPSQPVVVTQASEQAETQSLARLSTSSEREWGVSLGRFPSRFEAEQSLIQSALAEPSALASAVQRVHSGGRGHDALFLGLTRDEAERACRRLQARARGCFMLAPSAG